MPDGAFANMNWPLLLQTLSQSAGQREQTNTRNQQTDDLMQGELARQARQREIDALIGDEIAATAAHDPAGEQNKSLAAYTTALQQARARGSGVSEVNPSSLSEEYEQGTKAAGQQVRSRSSQRARNQASVAGSVRSRSESGIRRGRLGTEVDRIGRHANMDTFLAQLRARNRRPNPWIELLSGLGTQIGGHWDNSKPVPPPALPPGTVTGIDAPMRPPQNRGVV